MIYCYIDESGTASRKDKRPFIVAMAMFGSLDEVNGMIEKIRKFKLRNNIPQDFEFHYSRNAKTKKDMFVRREARSYRIFCVSKNDKSNPYKEVSDMIVRCLWQDQKYRISIDKNPRLYEMLKIALKQTKVVAKVKEVNSKNEALVQIADYLAGMASEE